MADQLMLTSARIKEELFTGGFRPMAMPDRLPYSGAEEGSLIAEISVGRFTYEVLFTPSLGNVQIYNYQNEDTLAWEMDLLTDKVIDLCV